jgi:hypothetical protein
VCAYSHPLIHHNSVPTTPWSSLPLQPRTPSSVSKVVTRTVFTREHHIKQTRLPCGQGLAWARSYTCATAAHVNQSRLQRQGKRWWTGGRVTPICSPAAGNFFSVNIPARTRTAWCKYSPWTQEHGRRTRFTCAWSCCRCLFWICWVRSGSIGSCGRHIY